MRPVLMICSLQGGHSGEAWRTLASHAPDLALVMESAFHVATGMDHATYAALRSLFPGWIPPFTPMEHAAAPALILFGLTWASDSEPMLSPS